MMTLVEEIARALEPFESCVPPSEYALGRAQAALSAILKRLREIDGITALGIAERLFPRHKDMRDTEFVKLFARAIADHLEGK